MAELKVEIDGKLVPLNECGWIERRPCGCIVAAVVAVDAPEREDGWVLATAGQAHRHLNPTKRDRDRATKAGLRTELITMTHYRKNIGANWECDQHQKATA
ncbi:hypothetical protein GCM10010293_39970 [Streptomyces griseoflavus]|uniref:hypothetical protein n=1 Tax=Streptomyces griseoflavus TaxID=35619 RepID=UPI00167D3D12|nr:hypothetical protein [Streptomyces griseoflavus]GGV36614.1 hypothetical protein GCM10010293_39970 [Streptomyces griseoflavus]